MSRDRRAARERSRQPSTEAAALAALSVSESLILAMVEAGSLDPQVLRRCLLDAAAGHENAAGAEDNGPEGQEAVHAAAVKLIDDLLRQVEAVTPSQRPAPHLNAWQSEKA